MKPFNNGIMNLNSTNNRYCLLSNDVETHSIWHNSLRDETGIRVYKEIMPKLLELYEQYNIKSTFFYTGYIAKLVPDIVKMVVDKGHEVGCHGLVHDIDKSFDTLSLKDQTNNLLEAKSLLEDISGSEVISFRAPALRVNRNTPKALNEAGFKIDSSISPQRFDFFISFGSLNKFQHIISPRKTYLTNGKNLAKKGNGPIIEVPLSSLIFPLVGSTMRSLPYINEVLRRVLTFESIIKEQPIVYYMHPNEFLNEKNEAYEGNERRAKNFIQYLLADILRRKIKIRNLGNPAFDLYKKQIEFFKKRHYKFITIQEYCKIHKLID